MRIASQQGQAGYPKTIEVQSDCGDSLCPKLQVGTQPAKVINQTNQKDDRSRSQNLDSQMQKRKFMRDVLRCHPTKQHDAPKSQEDCNSAQTRYLACMDVTVRTGTRVPAAGI